MTWSTPKKDVVPVAWKPNVDSRISYEPRYLVDVQNDSNTEGEGVRTYLDFDPVKMCFDMMQNLSIEYINKLSFPYTAYDKSGFAYKAYRTPADIWNAVKRQHPSYRPSLDGNNEQNK